MKPFPLWWVLPMPHPLSWVSIISAPPPIPFYECWLCPSPSPHFPSPLPYGECWLCTPCFPTPLCAGYVSPVPVPWTSASYMPHPPLYLDKCLLSPHHCLLHPAPPLCWVLAVSMIKVLHVVLHVEICLLVQLLCIHVEIVPIQY